jgi:osmoprotectant transport system substrate-binding protein
MEDFADYINSGGDIYMAASEDFLFRPDALPAFEYTYDFNVDGTHMFVIAQAFPTLTEQALVDGINGINASFALSTDALIQHYDLVLLEDTLGAQPVFQPTPVFRGDVLRTWCSHRKQRPKASLAGRD